MTITPETKAILDGSDPVKKRGLFSFSPDDSNDLILKKFRLWSRYFFPDYFIEKGTGEGIEDAPFHALIDQGNLMVYLGRERDFLDIAGRGLAKTARTKLFIAYAIANDRTHFRRYFKVLCRDPGNAQQITTDIYNMFVRPRVKALYPEIFEKTDAKREETMSSFTTATGIKVASDSVGTPQRGDTQDSARPDYVWMDDFEDSLSLMSSPTTKKIWANMEEAKNGLARNGGIVYTCNYISERGNVHKLVQKSKHKVITPIAVKGPDGKWVPTWSRFTREEIERLETDADDFEGEYLCKPSASMDVYFDRESVDRQVPKEPVDEVAGLKIFGRYDPSHRIGSGHDVGGGVGLDHSTSVFIDFDRFPAQVLATYKNNEIKPKEFAYEIARQCKRFGENYCAVEKNYGSTLDTLVDIYPKEKIHKTQRGVPKAFVQPQVEYGWDTNAVTKHTMLQDLAKAVEDGLIELNDPDLIDEARGYTRNDLIEMLRDPRKATRHFDLLMAAAIAYQTMPHVQKPKRNDPEDYWNPSNPRLIVLGEEKKSGDNPAV